LKVPPSQGVSGAPMDNNIMLWQAVIFGYVRVSLLPLVTLADPLEWCTVDPTTRPGREEPST
jgi:hypothetical protein